MAAFLAAGATVPHNRGSGRLSLQGRHSQRPGGLQTVGPRHRRSQVHKCKCVAAPDRTAVGATREFADIAESDLHTRQAKLVCTIGPKTCSEASIRELAEAGMNVVRLNMSHGTHEWHQSVIDEVRKLNDEGVFNLGILLDTKGPEVRSGDLKQPVEVKPGEKVIFTIRTSIPASMAPYTTEVSYDDFVHDVRVGDTLLVDGGICSFLIKEVTDVDVVTECLEYGVLTSRRHLNVRGKSASLPAITEKDWADIKFGLDNGVDFYALSFVKQPEDVALLKDYLLERGDDALVLAKIESAKSIEFLREILEVSDGAMVARGDLGSEIPFEEVPLVQEQIVQINLELKKPTIVATHMLESMIQYPMPSRAEITDIHKALQQGADATMLSGETAGGAYPLEAVNVMVTVARSVFGARRECPYHDPPPRDTEGEAERAAIAYSASVLACDLHARAIVCFTRKGGYAREVSSTRPHVPVIAFCPANETGLIRTMSLFWGVHALPLEFSKDPEETIIKAVETLKRRKIVQPKDYVVMTSDVLIPSSDNVVNTIQVRMIN